MAALKYFPVNGCDISVDRQRASDHGHMLLVVHSNNSRLDPRCLFAASYVRELPPTQVGSVRFDWLRASAGSFSFLRVLVLLNEV